MRKIGYARVSTADQNPQLQINSLNLAGCQEIYSEKESGGKVDRPELLKCLHGLQKGDTLVVWKLDRLARSTKQLIDIIEDLKAREIGFKSITENIDTTTPMGELVFHIFAGLAQFERSLIRERTIAGLEAAKSEGRIGGRPVKLTDSEIEEAVAMLEKGESGRAVAKHFGVSKDTIYRIKKENGV